MISGPCTKFAECRQKEQGFCNLAFGSTGYCLKCIDISGKCENDNRILLNSLEDCKAACEGIIEN